jgi:hypothetical protein
MALFLLSAPFDENVDELLGFSFASLKPTWFVSDQEANLRWSSPRWSSRNGSEGINGSGVARPGRGRGRTRYICSFSEKFFPKRFLSWLAKTLFAGAKGRNVRRLGCVGQNASKCVPTST